MPGNCAVYWCGNTRRITAGSNIRYFRFPKGRELRRQWLQACSRNNDLNPEYGVVCSIHFTPDDYKDDKKYRLLGAERPVRQRALKDDAVPSLFLRYGTKSAFEVAFDGYHKAENCGLKRTLQDIVSGRDDGAFKFGDTGSLVVPTKKLVKDEPSVGEHSSECGDQQTTREREDQQSASESDTVVFVEVGIV